LDTSLLYAPVLSGAHRATQHSRKRLNLSASALSATPPWPFEKKMPFHERFLSIKSESAFSIPEGKYPSSEDRELFVRTDLTRRLKNICENMSSAEFEVLLAKMTREQLRDDASRGRGVQFG
jgi:hypothetical protein